MTRLLAGLAVPVATLALAFAFVGPSLMPSLGGAPLMIVAAEASPAPLQFTSFQGEACALPAVGDGSSAGLRIVAVTVDSDKGHEAIGLQELANGTAPDASLLLLLDGSGRLLAVGDANSLTTDAAREALATECGDTDALANAI